MYCIAAIMYFYHPTLYWLCPVTHQRCWAQPWWQLPNPEQPVFASAGALFSCRQSQVTTLNTLPCPGASSVPQRWTEHTTLHCWDTSNRAPHTWSPLLPDMPQARRRPCLSKCALRKVSDTTWRGKIYVFICRAGLILPNLFLFQLKFHIIATFLILFLPLVLSLFCLFVIFRKEFNFELNINQILAHPNVTILCLCITPINIT